MRLPLILILLLVPLYAGEVDDAILGLSSSNPLTRRSSATVLGKSNSDAAMQALAKAMYDADTRVREAACVSFWEQPRNYTLPIVTMVLGTVKLNDPVVQQYAAENLGIILGVLTQRNQGVPPVPNQNPYKLALTPDEFKSLERMYTTKNEKLLKPLLPYYFMLNPQVTPECIIAWIWNTDDTISTQALRMAPVTTEKLLPVLTKRWDNATEQWQMQCVQISSGNKAFSDWLKTLKSQSIKVTDLIKVVTATPTTPEGFRELRKLLSTPLALQRWSHSLVQLQKAGLPIALDCLENDTAVTQYILEIWGIYQVPLPEDVALKLLDDKRKSIRQFAIHTITKLNPSQIKQLAKSEFLDVRLLAVRLTDPNELDDYLIDESADIRTLAVCRWLQSSNRDIENVLLYGLSDPVTQDAVLLAAVLKPELMASLNSWAETPLLKQKLQNAKTITTPPTPPKP